MPHLLAVGFIALVFQVLLLDANFTHIVIQCEPPITYVAEPRPVEDFSSEQFDDAPYCWDAAQRHVRFATFFLSSMAASWTARTIAVWRGRRGLFFLGLFIVLGVAALAGDWAYFLGTA